MFVGTAHKLRKFYTNHERIMPILGNYVTEFYKIYSFCSSICRTSIEVKFVVDNALPHFNLISVACNG